MANLRAATGQDKLLPNFTKFFFNRPRITAVVFLALALFGVASYTTLLKREGFPSVNVPFAIISGSYSSQNPEEVDAKVAKPIGDIALHQANVSAVQTQSGPNFFTVQVQYKEGTDARKATTTIKQAASNSGKLPAQARVQYNVPYFGVTGGDVQKVDLAISFYAKDNKASTQQLNTVAQSFAQKLNEQNMPGVKHVFVKSPFTAAVNPATGQEEQVQRTFDRYGQRQSGNNKYYSSILIGVEAVKGEDVIKLDNSVRAGLAAVSRQPEFNNYNAQISASYAPSIKENISELQRVLLEGLVAVLVVGSIIIAVRASIITVLSMLTVLLTVIGLLYVIGYTLNVITLFALILGLSLIVDDTIIMVEAIDAARRRQKTPQAVVQQASRKVSRAMVAATTTAALSFAPLLFVGGILGGFIRAIPVTIISALITSLFVALVFIPFFARFILLGKKQLGEKGVVEVAAGFEAGIARGIAKPMLWARGSTKRLFTLGIIALVVGFGFIGTGLALSQKVVFNIFPPTKDTNGLVIQLAYPPNTPIQQSEAIAAKADQIAAHALGENFVDASYYNTGSSDSASQVINIISYEKRAVTSPQLVKQLQQTYDSQFTDAKVTVGQADIGPPTASFVAQIDATNRPAAQHAANDLAAYLRTQTLTRLSGKTAHYKNITVSSASQVIRSGGKPIIRVSAGFDGDDTTTLVTLAQDNIKKEFTATKLASYGLPKNSLTFDLGQESDNQNSFKSLALAFPILLFVIFLVLSVQFRSLLQPLLIFMAIPFSIFGVMFGLYITNNPISFFAMLGFFALIGLSIKNTILLTDFANQTRRAGGTPVEAAVAALEERFRPLVATSVTAVVSLIPLALTSPFWQGLAVVLIFGLISSTLLVITVFPYYYLGAEYLRSRVSRKGFFTWMLIFVLATFIMARIMKPLPAAGVGIVLASAYFAIRRNRRKKATAKV